MAPSDQHRVAVKFPRGQCNYDFQEASPEVLARFHHAKTGLTLASVQLKDGGRVSVDGFGIPFANASDPDVEAWVNHNGLNADNVTFMDVLLQDKFYFLIANSLKDLIKNFAEERLPPPFSYPYGTTHNWNQGRFEKLLVETKAKDQFQPAY